METTTKSASFQIVDGQKFDFNIIWNNFLVTMNQTWELFKKNPLNFILVFALPVIFGALIMLVLFPMIFGSLYYGNLFLAGIITLLFMVLLYIFQYYAYGCALRAISDQEKKAKIDIKEVMMFVKDHFIDSVKVAIKVFIYTQAWIPLVVFLAGILVSAMGYYSMGPLLLMAAPIVAIVILIIYFKRIVNASFSLMYFFDMENPKVDEAFDASLKMAEGKTITLFSNYVMIGLVTGLAAAIIGAIINPIFYSIDGGAGLASNIAGAVVGAFAVIGQFMTKLNAEKLSGHKSIVDTTEAKPLL